MEKTVRKDRTGKTRGLLPGFCPVSLIFCLVCLAAACENAAEPVVTVVTVGGNEDEDLAEEGTPPEPPEENPDPPHIGGGAGEYPGVKVKSVTLDETEIELAVGDTYQLTATADPPEAPVTWFSRKAGAVSVDGTGLVTRQGWGTAEVVAKAGGKSAVCVVTAGPKSAGLYQIVSETEEDEIDVSARTEDTMLAKALAYIKASGEDDARYEIVLDEDVADDTGAGYTIGTGPSGSSTGVRTNLSITVRGVEDSTVTITKDAAGPLFTVYGNIGDTPELVLENITLAGYSENNSALVVVGNTGNAKQGKLTMKAGSRITGNTNSSSGGGVSVIRGAFLMQDGRIDDNHVKDSVALTVAGGGVYSAGTFEMNGGHIENNTVESEREGGASIYGGGVYSTGSFTMSGGSIENNHCIATTGDSYDYCSGGGVDARNFTMSGDACIANNSAVKGGGVSASYGTFTMEGGTISGNRAARFGAGVYVPTNIVFAKSGGVIYGTDAGADSNKAAEGITGTVHAIEVMQGLGQEVTTKYYFDTNAGEDVHLSSAESAGWQQ